MADLLYPAHLGRGHLDAGSPLAHVAQLSGVMTSNYKDARAKVFQRFRALNHAPWFPPSFLIFLKNNNWAKLDLSLRFIKALHEGPQLLFIPLFARFVRRHYVVISESSHSWLATNVATCYQTGPL